MKTILKVVKYISTASMLIAGGVVIGLTTAMVEKVFDNAIEECGNTKED